MERIKINITAFDKCYKASQHPLLGVFGFHTDYKYCQVVIEKLSKTKNTGVCRLLFKYLIFK